MPNFCFKNGLGTLACVHVLEKTFKSCTIPICLSDCLSYKVTRILRCFKSHIASELDLNAVISSQCERQSTCSKAQSFGGKTKRFFSIQNVLIGSLKKI